MRNGEYCCAFKGPGEGQELSTPWDHILEPPMGLLDRLPDLPLYPTQDALSVFILVVDSDSSRSVATGTMRHLICYEASETRGSARTQGGGLLQFQPNQN